MGDALANFVSVMTRGARSISGGSSEPDKVEVRTYERDITPDLQGLMGVKATRKDVGDWWADVVGHLPRCEVNVQIAAGSKTWQKIDANEILDNKFGMLTHELVQGGLPDLAKSMHVILMKADYDLPPQLGDGPPSDKVKAAIDNVWAEAQKTCNAKIIEFQTKIGAEVMAEVRKTFTELRETKNAVSLYRFVAGARIFKGVLVIAGNIAHAAASWGATSPLAIVLIVRECIEIGQIVGKGLADADQLGKLVQFDLATIHTFYTDEQNAGKAQNNTAEVITGIISGVTALEIPSVKNCKTHIGDFDHKVNQLDLKYVDMGKKLVKLRDKVADLDKKIKKVGKLKGQYHKKLSNEEVMKNLGVVSQAFGDTYKDLFEAVEPARLAVEGLRKNSEDWTVTLSGYEKNTGKWTKHVSTLAAVATEAGLGLGHIGGEHVEGAVEIAAQHLKLGLEAGTVVMNGLSDKVLELLAES